MPDPVCFAEIQAAVFKHYSEFALDEKLAQSRIERGKYRS